METNGTELAPLTVSHEPPEEDDGNENEWHDNGVWDDDDDEKHSDDDYHEKEPGLSQRIRSLVARRHELQGNKTTLIVAILALLLIGLAFSSNKDGSNAGKKDKQENGVDLSLRNIPYEVVTSSFDGIETTKTVYVTPTAQTQIKSYRKDKGLILNIHLTHHAGTTMCHDVGKAVGAPSFACMGLKPEDHVPKKENFPNKEIPWTYNETEPNLQIVRKYFRYISWELGHIPKVDLMETNWENPHLVSVLVMKHPLARILSGDGYISKTYPGIKDNTANEAEWWAFARDERQNNFALARLSQGRECCFNEKTNVTHVHTAQALIRRMTFVIDVECLDENLQALSQILGFPLNAETNQKSAKKHPPLKERFPPEIYKYLAKRNKRDIELYEWSKSLSLVKCDG